MKRRELSIDTVPKAVVGRLSLYLRELQKLSRAGKQTISSTELGRLLSITDAQVRKDFAYFGQFGHPGVGYRCDQLILEIRRILGTDRMWPVALVGVGNLGQALLGYRGFVHQGFSIIAAFDMSPAMVGRDISGVVILPMEQLEAVVKANRIQIGILAVPAEASAAVAARLNQAGIKSILNFAPVLLPPAEGVTVVNVDLAIELEQLSFAVCHPSISSPSAGDPNAADTPNR